MSIRGSYALSVQPEAIGLSAGERLVAYAWLIGADILILNALLFWVLIIAATMGLAAVAVVEAVILAVSVADAVSKRAHVARVYHVNECGFWRKRDGNFTLAADWRRLNDVEGMLTEDSGFGEIISYMLCGYAGRLPAVKLRFSDGQCITIHRYGCVPHTAKSLLLPIVLQSPIDSFLRIRWNTTHYAIWSSLTQPARVHWTYGAIVPVVIVMLGMAFALFSPNDRQVGVVLILFGVGLFGFLALLRKLDIF